MQAKKIGILLLSVCLSILFVSLTILTGCSNDSKTTPTTSAISTTPAPQTTTTSPAASSTTPASTIKMKYYLQQVPGTTPYMEAMALAEVLSESSNGRIEVTVYPAEQLGPVSAVMDLLKNGVTDIASFGMPPYKALFPLENGQELALSVTSDMITALKLRNKLTLGDYGQAFPKNNLKFLSWSIGGPQQFFLTKKVTKAEDFKGMKIRAPDPLTLAPFQTFGLVPVSMPMGEVYESLQRGVLDGFVNAPENAVANKWHEVTKFNISHNLAYGGGVMVMSQRSWSSLPADLQAVVDQAVSQKWLPKIIAIHNEQTTKALTTLKSSGVDVYTLDSAEAERWHQMQAPVVDDWAAKTDAPGVPAKAMVEEIRKAAK